MEMKEDDHEPILFPDSIHLKLDPDLKLSHNIEEQLKGYISVTEPKCMDKVLRNTPPFPSTYKLLLMAKAAYKSFYKRKSTRDYEKKVNLPEGWKLLTIAENHATTNGYFGAAYLNASCSQVVIAHRGTKFSKVGALWTDVYGVFMTNYVSQMNSACTFAHLVLSAVRRIEKERKGVRFEVFFTGHSLGGWLSQVTTFSLNYLSPVDLMFKKSFDPNLECHSHAVVFDSPGCKEMLLKMADTFQVRYGDSPISLDTLNITSYLSAPNRVNCCNSHVGTVFRIFPDLTNLIRKTNYNLESHSSSNILSTFDPDTGQVSRDPRGKLKIQHVVDWPVISGILKSSEYKTFFQWATHLNNYNPDTSSSEYEEEIRKRRGYCPIRYQTTDYKDNQRNCAVFTQTERGFLEKYQWFNGLPKHFKGRVIFDAQNEDFINKKMRCFSVRKQYITCSSVEELDVFVPFVKAVLQQFPNCVNNVTSVLSSLDAKKRIYEIESESYCRYIEKWSMQFTGMDLPAVTDFIKSDGPKVLNVVVNGDHTDITVARIHNVIQRHREANAGCYLQLELQNILTINKSVSFKELLEWDQLGKTFLVIECNSQAMSSSYFWNLFTDILLILRSKTRIKMILVTKKDTTEMGLCSGILRDHYTTVEASGPTWEHLTLETRRDLLSRELVVFQGHRIALESLMDKDQDETWKNAIDYETVIKLVKGEEVYIGRNLVRLDDVSDFYVNRSFLDELNTRKTYNECDFLNTLDANKFHVIVDKSGMGKTTVITNLVLTLKKMCPQIWIIRVNLNDCTVVLRDKLAENREHNAVYNVAMAPSTLIDLMESNTVTKLSTTFEKNLLKRALLYNGKVTLFLDGYDEISPDYEEIILNFLRSLTECKIQNVIIATRPHTKRNLQNELQPKSHTLRAFSKEDQKYFLVRFWQRSLRDTSHGLDLEKYSKDMIERLNSAINDDERTFTGIPLQCRLVAEVFRDYLIKGELEIPEQLNLMRLYDTFATKKLKIYEIEKCVDNRGNVNALLDRSMVDKTMLHCHRQLALKITLGENNFRALGLSNFDDDVLEIRAMKVGLLLRGGQVPQFIHRTIAEYFVADFFAAHLENYNSVKCLATEVLLRPQYRVVRSFLNGKLKGQKSEQFGQHMAQAFISDKDSFLGTKKQTALHVLVREELGDLLHFALDCCGKDSLNADTLLPFIAKRNVRGETALFNALKYVGQDFARPFFQSLSNCSVKVKRTLILASTFRHTSNEEDIYMKDLFALTDNDPGFSNVLRGIEAKLSLISPFLQAASRGSVEDLRQILEKAGDDETRYYLLRAHEKRAVSNLFYSALHWAAENGHVEATKFLIENGAPFGYATMDEPVQVFVNRTPLQVAILASNEEIVSIILESVPTRRPCNTTLELAAKVNNAAIYYSLVAKTFGFELATTKKLCCPSLHEQNMLIWSLCKDNSRNWENIAFESYKMLKVDKLRDAVLYMLNEGAEVNKPDKNGLFPMHWAILSRRKDIVSFLIQNGANVNTRSKINGQTPLIFASSIGDNEIVQLLLSKGAEINACDDTYSTSLHYSITIGHIDVVQTLLANSATNVNAVNQDIYAALHIAAGQGCTIVAVNLLDKGANMEATDLNKSTALHYASARGHVEIVQVLLERGANVMALDKKSRTALHRACFSGHGNVARCLIDHGANCNAHDVNMKTPLHNASILGHTETVVALLENGARVNDVVDDGRTALNFAFSNGHTDVINRLLQYGAEMNVLDI